MYNRLNKSGYNLQITVCGRNDYEQHRNYNFWNYMDSSIAIMVLGRKYHNGHYMVMRRNYWADYRIYKTQ